MKYYSEEEEESNRSLLKFESMLKTNKILFFDSLEFEEIVLHYLDTGKLNFAKKALKLALEQHPNSFGLKLVQVEMLIFENNLDTAEKILNDLIELDPKNDEVYILKSSLFSKKGLHQLAIQQLEIALLHTEDFAELYNILGMEYLYLDKFENAKQSFIKCLENDIENQSSLYNVVYCFEFLEQYKEAIDFLEDYIEKYPYSEIAWHQVGRLQYGLKNYIKAIQAFEYATYIDEDFIGAYMELAKALEKTKKYRDAIENYTKTLDLDDATSYALLRIGKCYEKLGNKPMALKFYYKTVHEDPLLDKAWFTISGFYKKEKKYSKALYYINKALSLDNNNCKYWRRFAHINRKIKNYTDAEFGYKKAIETGDLHFDTWLFWIAILQHQNEFEKAISTLLLASDFFPENDEIEIRLCGLYFLLKKNIKAKYHLKSAMKINNESLNILKELYPTIWEMKIVQEFIEKHLN